MAGHLNLVVAVVNQSREFSWIPQVYARARSRLRRTSVAVHALLVETDRLRCFLDQLVETRIAAQLIPARI